MNKRNRLIIQLHKPHEKCTILFCLIFVALRVCVYVFEQYVNPKLCETKLLSLPFFRFFFFHSCLKFGCSFFGFFSQIDTYIPQMYDVRSAFPFHCFFLCCLFILFLFSSRKEKTFR